MLDSASGMAAMRLGVGRLGEEDDASDRCCNSLGSKGECPFSAVDASGVSGSGADGRRMFMASWDWEVEESVLGRKEETSKSSVCAWLPRRRSPSRAWLFASSPSSPLSKLHLTSMGTQMIFSPMSCLPIQIMAARLTSSAV